MHIPRKAPDSPATRQYIYHTLVLFIAISVILLLLLSACASTTSDPDFSSIKNDPDSSGDLTVSISTPSEYTFPGTGTTGNALTRDGDADLHAGHQLRFIAKLYKYDDNSRYDTDAADSGCVSRVEQLASAGNQVIFRNVDPGLYYITVFADYIDANATPDADGCYPDKYYTHARNGTGDARYVYYNLTDASEAGSFFLNNHNLDCFHGRTNQFTKKANESIERTITLSRRVSQVQVIHSGSENLSSLKDITVKSFTVYDEYAWPIGLIQNNAPSSVAAEKRVFNTNGGYTITPADPASKLLFFHYSFTPDLGNEHPIDPINFSMNPLTEEGYSYGNTDFYTPSNKIFLNPNIIYKVQADFIDISESPSTNTDIKVTTDTNWINSDQELP